MKTRNWPNPKHFSGKIHSKDENYWDFIKFELLEILNKNPDFTNLDFHNYIVDNGLGKKYSIIEISKTWGFWFSSKR
jgi:hypothetical protein